MEKISLQRLVQIENKGTLSYDPHLVKLLFKITAVTFLLLLVSLRAGVVGN